MSAATSYPVRRTGLFATAFATVLASLAPAAHADGATTTETIVFVRHGEKPAAGFGQLNCRGLARSLALPAVIETRFGRPDAVFAPSPASRKPDGGVPYDYVRPLATVEPTAIRFGLPVDTRFGWNDLDGLEAALLAPERAGSRLLVGWEHDEIVEITRRLLARFGGDPASVPKWRGGDFDRVHVLTLTRTPDGGTRAELTIEHEGLDDLPDACPTR